MKTSLKFLGAAQTVTGSCTLFTYKDHKFLIDCGLFQGPKKLRNLNWDKFDGANEVHSVLLTHAHIDHSGYLPKLKSEGFNGKVHCSHATHDLCKIMLTDSGHLQEEDAKYAAKTKHSKHDPPLPLYTVKDAVEVLQHFTPHNFNSWIDLVPGLQFRLKRAGHILGSAFIQLKYENEHNKTSTVTFSGDLGHDRHALLQAPEQLQKTDYLVLESTYGNRQHSRESVKEQLAKIINSTCSKDGVLVIPSFAVGRTQELLFTIKKLEEEGSIPMGVPVFLDSPMATEATVTHIKHNSFFKIKGDKKMAPELITPSNFKATSSVEQSKDLCTIAKGPFIVISASGMLTGGRILHHIKNRIVDAKNTVLFIGYQAKETKGKLIQDGIPSIRIHHQAFPVKARIESIDGLSAHGDIIDIMNWLNNMESPPKKIFLNHGETESINAFKYHIEHELGIDVETPEPEEEFLI